MSEEQEQVVVEDVQEVVSEEQQVEVTVDEPVTEPQPEALPVVVPKKKRKRSPAQIKALGNARKMKGEKKRKVLKKPLKIERNPASVSKENSDISWSRDCPKCERKGRP